MVPWGVLLLCGLAAGCGKDQVDETDELGAEPPEGDERYELIILKPAGSDSLAAGWAGSAPTPPPAKVSRPATGPPQAGPLPAADQVRPAVPAGAVAETPELPSAASSGAEAAAQALPGVLDPGPSQPVVFDAGGEFTVQVGLFAHLQAARELVNELTDDGYPAYALAASGKGVRVRIGYFRTHEDAHRFGEIFRRDRGLTFWVDRRENER